MEGAAGHSDDLLVREVIDKDRGVLLELESRAETPVGAIAPQVDLACLRDRCAVALTGAHVGHTQVGQHDYLCRREDVLFGAVAEAPLLSAPPGEELRLLRDAHGVKGAAFDLADREVKAILLDAEERRLRDALNRSEAEGAILSVAPRVHLAVAGEGQDVADAARNLNDLGAEAREGYDSWPSDDRHLGLRCSVLFRALRAGVQVELPGILVSGLLSLGGLGVDDRQLLIEGEQLGVALAVHEELDGLLLEAQGEVFQLLERDLAVVLIEDLRDRLDVIQVGQLSLRELVNEFLPLNVDLAWVCVLCTLSSGVLAQRRFEGTGGPIFRVELAIAAFPLVATHLGVLISGGSAASATPILLLSLLLEQPSEGAFLKEDLAEHPADLLNCRLSRLWITVKPLLVLWHDQGLLKVPLLLLFLSCALIQLLLLDLEIDLTNDKVEAGACGDADGFILALTEH